MIVSIVFLFSWAAFVSLENRNYFLILLGKYGT